MNTRPRKSSHSAALSVLLHENFPEMLPDIINLIFYFINSFPATFEILKSFQSIAFSSQKIKSVCAEGRPLISIHRRKSSNDIAKHLAGNYQLSYVQAALGGMWKGVIMDGLHAGQEMDKWKRRVRSNLHVRTFVAFK